MYHHHSMKTTEEAYLSNQECSVQEAVHHILPELKLQRILLVVYFVNTNPPQERVQLLLSEKELSKLPNNNPPEEETMLGGRIRQSFDITREINFYSLKKLLIM